MISKTTIKNGIAYGSIRFIKCPDGDGTVCKIGEHWFYFDGSAEDMCPAEYIAAHSLEELTAKVYKGLVALILEVNSDEYAYYEAFLNGKKSLFKETPQKLLDDIGMEESARLFSYPLCELDATYLGFLENYISLQALIPKDFVIIDIGSYQSFQGNCFKGHAAYIGVEPNVDLEYRLRQDNAKYYLQTGQQFIKETLPTLIDKGLDLQKTFAVCSAVPDEQLRELVAETFPFHSVEYPGVKSVATYPESALDRSQGFHSLMLWKDDFSSARKWKSVCEALNVSTNAVEIELRGVVCCAKEYARHRSCLDDK